MEYCYLILAVFMSAASSVLGKMYDKRQGDAKGGIWFYNLLLGIGFFLLWGIAYVFDFSFSVGVLLCSMLFAVGFCVYNWGLVQALKYGTTSLTTLFTSMSLLLTTFWGFIFWGAKPNLIVVIGLIMVVSAIYFCLYTDKKEPQSFSWKWLFFSVLAMLGQAVCAIVQRTQQMHFEGQHGTMMMTFAALFTMLLFLVLYFTNGKAEVKNMAKTWYFPVLAGISNMFLNFFVILLAVSSLSPSLIYPVLGVGGLITVTIFSLFAFKEKLKWQQWLGVALGAVATILLSI